MADLQAKKPSSSSRRLGAGNGAPGPSSLRVGRLTYPPPLPNGLSDCSLALKEVEVLEVVTGSGSRRLQPNEFMESLKEFDAICRASGKMLLGCGLVVLAEKRTIVAQGQPRKAKRMPARS